MSLKKKQKNPSKKKKLTTKKPFPSTKETVFMPLTSMDISTHNPQNHFTLIVPTTIMSDSITPNMANQKIGKTSFLRNTIPMKTSLPRKILTNYLNEDLGTTQLNLPLGLQPFAVHKARCGFFLFWLNLCRTLVASS